MAFKFRAVNFTSPLLFKTYLDTDQECEIKLTENNGLEMSNLFKIINLQSMLMIDATPVIQAARKLRKDDIDQQLLEVVNPTYVGIKEIHFYPLKYLIKIGYILDRKWIFYITHNLNGQRDSKNVITEEQS